jgi:transposase
MYHVGIDQHKHFSQIAVLDKENVKQYKLYHQDKDQIKEFFAAFEGNCSVTMEATGNWYWLYDILEQLKMKVKLAHPLKTRAIAEAKVKTDKIDAKTLAYLDRADLVACAYLAPADIRQQRQKLRYRQSLVKMRSAVKCKIHALLDQQGIIASSFSDLFGKRGMQYLKGLKLLPSYQRSLAGYIELIEHLNNLITTITANMAKELKKDEKATLLMSVPGIGITLAHLLLAEIGDIRRFLSQDKLCAYAGLVPSTYQTANTRYHGRITKQGNKYIRWAMTEAAQMAVSKDPALKSFYNKLSRKKGSSKAKIAVARKLLIAVYQILKRNIPYKNNYLTRINLGKPALGTGHSK